MAQLELERPAPINPNGQIFFVHIPKCAGTSLGERLAKQVDEKLVIRSSEYPHDKLAALSAEHFSKVRYMGGHYAEVYRRTYVPSSQAITGLRDPVKRLRSIVRHGARGQRFRSWMAPLYETQDPNFLMTDESRRNFLLHASQVIYLLPNALADLTPEYGLSDEAFEKANETLRNCACVYTDESFDEFSRKLGGLFNDPPIERAERLNSAPNKEQWIEDLDFVKIADHLCPWDVHVYELAQQRAAETLAALGNSTSPEQYAAWWQKQPQNKQVAVDFGAPYKSQGLGIRRKIPYGLSHVVKSRRMVELAENNAYIDVRRPKNSRKLTLWLTGGECFDNPPAISCDGVELQTSATNLAGVIRHSAKLPRVGDDALPYIRIGLKFKERAATARRGHLLSVTIS
ncbi:MAG: hypothetical protein RIC14_00380 [Filomicrobium sp.]